MPQDYGVVAAAALSLTETERAELAAELLDSLDVPLDEDVEAAWREEIARRTLKADRGSVPGTPWGEVKAALRLQAEIHDAR